MDVGGIIDSFEESGKTVTVDRLGSLDHRELVKEDIYDSCWKNIREIMRQIMEYKKEERSLNVDEDRKDSNMKFSVREDFFKTQSFRNDMRREIHSIRMKGEELTEEGWKRLIERKNEVQAQESVMIKNSLMMSTNSKTLFQWIHKLLEDMGNMLAISMKDTKDLQDIARHVIEEFNLEMVYFLIFEIQTWFLKDKMLHKQREYFRNIILIEIINRMERHLTETKLKKGMKTEAELKEVMKNKINNFKGIKEPKVNFYEKKLREIDEYVKNHIGGWITKQQEALIRINACVAREQECIFSEKSSKLYSKTMYKDAYEVQMKKYFKESQYRRNMSEMQKVMDDENDSTRYLKNFIRDLEREIILNTDGSVIEAKKSVEVYFARWDEKRISWALTIMSEDEINITPLMKDLLMVTWVPYLCSFISKRKEDEEKKIQMRKEARRKEKEEEAATWVNHIEGYFENWRDPGKMKEIEEERNRRREIYHKEFYPHLVLEENKRVSTPTIIKEASVNMQENDKPRQVYATSKPIKASQVGKWKTPMKPVSYNTVIATSKPIAKEIKRDEWMTVDKKGKRKIMEDVKTPVDPTINDYMTKTKSIKSTQGDITLGNKGEMFVPLYNKINKFVEDIEELQIKMGWLENSHLTDYEKGLSQIIRYEHQQYHIKRGDIDLVKIRLSELINDINQEEGVNHQSDEMKGIINDYRNKINLTCHSVLTPVNGRQMKSQHQLTKKFVPVRKDTEQRQLIERWRCITDTDGAIRCIKEEDMEGRREEWKKQGLVPCKLESKWSTPETVASHKTDSYGYQTPIVYTINKDVKEFFDIPALEGEEDTSRCFIPKDYLHVKEEIISIYTKMGKNMIIDIDQDKQENNKKDINNTQESIKSVTKQSSEKQGMNTPQIKQKVSWADMESDDNEEIKSEHKDKIEPTADIIESVEDKVTGKGNDKNEQNADTKEKEEGQELVVIHKDKRMRLYMAKGNTSKIKVKNNKKKSKKKREEEHESEGENESGEETLESEADTTNRSNRRGGSRRGSIHNTPPKDYTEAHLNFIKNEEKRKSIYTKIQTYSKEHVEQWIKNYDRVEKANFLIKYQKLEEERLLANKIRVYEEKKDKKFWELFSEDFIKRIYSNTKRQRHDNEKNVNTMKKLLKDLIQEKDVMTKDEISSYLEGKNECTSYPTFLRGELIAEMTLDNKKFQLLKYLESAQEDMNYEERIVSMWIPISVKFKERAKHIIDRWFVLSDEHVRMIKIWLAILIHRSGMSNDYPIHYQWILNVKDKLNLTNFINDMEDNVLALWILEEIATVETDNNKAKWNQMIKKCFPLNQEIGEKIGEFVKSTSNPYLDALRGVELSFLNEILMESLKHLGIQEEHEKSDYTKIRIKYNSLDKQIRIPNLLYVMYRISQIITEYYEENLKENKWSTNWYYILCFCEKQIRDIIYHEIEEDLNKELEDDQNNLLSRIQLMNKWIITLDEEDLINKKDEKDETKFDLKEVNHNTKTSVNIEEKKDTKESKKETEMKENKKKEVKETDKVSLNKGKEKKDKTEGDKTGNEKDDVNNSFIELMMRFYSSIYKGEEIRKRVDEIITVVLGQGINISTGRIRNKERWEDMREENNRFYESSENLEKRDSKDKIVLEIFKQSYENKQHDIYLTAEQGYAIWKERSIKCQNLYLSMGMDIDEARMQVYKYGNSKNQELLTRYKECFVKGRTSKEETLIKQIKKVWDNLYPNHMDADTVIEENFITFLKDLASIKFSINNMRYKQNSFMDIGIQNWKTVVVDEKWKKQYETLQKTFEYSLMELILSRQSDTPLKANEKSIRGEELLSFYRNWKGDDLIMNIQNVCETEVSKEDEETENVDKDESMEKKTENNIHNEQSTNKILMGSSGGDEEEEDNKYKKSLPEDKTDNPDENLQKTSTDSKDDKEDIKPFDPYRLSIGNQTTIRNIQNELQEEEEEHTARSKLQDEEDLLIQEKKEVKRDVTNINWKEVTDWTQFSIDELNIIVNGQIWTQMNKKTRSTLEQLGVSYVDYCSEDSDDEEDETLANTIGAELEAMEKDEKKTQNNIPKQIPTPVDLFNKDDILNHQNDNLINQKVSVGRLEQDDIDEQEEKRDVNQISQVTNDFKKTDDILGSDSDAKSFKKLNNTGRLRKVGDKENHQTLQQKTEIKEEKMDKTLDKTKTRDKSKKGSREIPSNDSEIQITSHIKKGTNDNPLHIEEDTKDKSRSERNERDEKKEHKKYENQNNPITRQEFNLQEKMLTPNEEVESFVKTISESMTDYCERKDNKERVDKFMDESVSRINIPEEIFNFNQKEKSALTGKLDTINTMSILKVVGRKTKSVKEGMQTIRDTMHVVRAARFKSTQTFELNKKSIGILLIPAGTIQTMFFSIKTIALKIRAQKEWHQDFLSLLIWLLKMIRWNGLESYIRWRYRVGYIEKKEQTHLKKLWEIMDVIYMVEDLLNRKLSPLFLMMSEFGNARISPIGWAIQTQKDYSNNSYIQVKIGREDDIVNIVYNKPLIHNMILIWIQMRRYDQIGNTLFKLSKQERKTLPNHLILDYFHRAWEHIGALWSCIIKIITTHEGETTLRKMEVRKNLLESMHGKRVWQWVSLIIRKILLPYATREAFGDRHTSNIVREVWKKICFYFEDWSVPGMLNDRGNMDGGRELWETYNSPDEIPLKDRHKIWWAYPQEGLTYDEVQILVEEDWSKIIQQSEQLQIGLYFNQTDHVNRNREVLHLKISDLVPIRKGLLVHRPMEHEPEVVESWLYTGSFLKWRNFIGNHAPFEFRRQEEILEDIDEEYIHMRDNKEIMKGRRNFVSEQNEIADYVMKFKYLDMRTYDELDTFQETLDVQRIKEWTKIFTLNQENKATKPTLNSSFRNNILHKNTPNQDRGRTSKRDREERSVNLTPAPQLGNSREISNDGKKIKSNLIIKDSTRITGRLKTKEEVMEEKKREQSTGIRSTSDRSRNQMSTTDSIRKQKYQEEQDRIIVSSLTASSSKNPPSLNTSYLRNTLENLERVRDNGVPLQKIEEVSKLTLPIESKSGRNSSQTETRWGEHTEKIMGNQQDIKEPINTIRQDPSEGVNLENSHRKVIIEDGGQEKKPSIKQVFEERCDSIVYENQKAIRYTGFFIKNFIENDGNKEKINDNNIDNFWASREFGMEVLLEMNEHEIEAVKRDRPLKIINRDKDVLKGEWITTKKEYYERKKEEESDIIMKGDDGKERDERKRKYDEDMDDPSRSHGSKNSKTTSQGDGKIWTFDYKKVRRQNAEELLPEYEFLEATQLPPLTGVYKSVMKNNQSIKESIQHKKNILQDRLELCWKQAHQREEARKYFKTQGMKYIEKMVDEDTSDFKIISITEAKQGIPRIQVMEFNNDWINRMNRVNPELINEKIKFTGYYDKRTQIIPDAEWRSDRALKRYNFWIIESDEQFKEQMFSIWDRHSYVKFSPVFFTREGMTNVNNVFKMPISKQLMEVLKQFYDEWEILTEGELEVCHKIIKKMIQRMGWSYMTDLFNFNLVIQNTCEREFYTNLHTIFVLQQIFNGGLEETFDDQTIAHWDDIPEYGKFLDILEHWPPHLLFTTLEKKNKEILERWGEDDIIDNSILSMFIKEKEVFHHTDIKRIQLITIPMVSESDGGRIIEILLKMLLNRLRLLMNEREMVEWRNNDENYDTIPPWNLHSHFYNKEFFTSWGELCWDLKPTLMMISSYLISASRQIFHKTDDREIWNEYTWPWSVFAIMEYTKRYNSDQMTFREALFKRSLFREKHIRPTRAIGMLSLLDILSISKDRYIKEMKLVELNHTGRVNWTLEQLRREELPGGGMKLMNHYVDKEFIERSYDVVRFPWMSDNRHDMKRPSFYIGKEVNPIIEDLKDETKWPKIKGRINMIKTVLKKKGDLPAINEAFSAMRQQTMMMKKKLQSKVTYETYEEMENLINEGYWNQILEDINDMDYVDDDRFEVITRCINRFIDSNVISGIREFIQDMIRGNHRKIAKLEVKLNNSFETDKPTSKIQIEVIESINRNLEVLIEVCLQRAIVIETTQLSGRAMTQKIGRGIIKNKEYANEDNESIEDNFSIETKIAMSKDTRFQRESYSHHRYGDMGTGENQVSNRLEQNLYQDNRRGQEKPYGQRKDFDEHYEDDMGVYSERGSHSRLSIYNKSDINRMGEHNKIDGVQAYRGISHSQRGSHSRPPKEDIIEHKEQNSMLHEYDTNDYYEDDKMFDKTNQYRLSSLVPIESNDQNYEREMTKRNQWEKRRSDLLKAEDERKHKQMIEELRIQNEILKKQLEEKNNVKTHKHEDSDTKHRRMEDNINKVINNTHQKMLEDRKLNLPNLSTRSNINLDRDSNKGSDRPQWYKAPTRSNQGKFQQGFREHPSGSYREGGDTPVDNQVSIKLRELNIPTDLFKRNRNWIFNKTYLNRYFHNVRTEKDIDNLNDFDLFTAFLFTPSKPENVTPIEFTRFGYFSYCHPVFRRLLALVRNNGIPITQDFRLMVSDIGDHEILLANGARICLKSWKPFMQNDQSIDDFSMRTMDLEGKLLDERDINEKRENAMKAFKKKLGDDITEKGREDNLSWNLEPDQLITCFKTFIDRFGEDSLGALAIVELKMGFMTITDKWRYVKHEKTKNDNPEWKLFLMETIPEALRTLSTDLTESIFFEKTMRTRVWVWMAFAHQREGFFTGILAALGLYISTQDQTMDLENRKVIRNVYLGLLAATTHLAAIMHKYDPNTFGVEAPIVRLMLINRLAKLIDPEMVYKECVEVKVLTMDQMNNKPLLLGRDIYEYLQFLMELKYDNMRNEIIKALASTEMKEDQYVTIEEPRQYDCSEGRKKPINIARLIHLMQHGLLGDSMLSGMSKTNTLPTGVDIRPFVSVFLQSIAVALGDVTDTSEVAPSVMICHSHLQSLTMTTEELKLINHRFSIYTLAFYFDPNVPEDMLFGSGWTNRKNLATTKIIQEMWKIIPSIHKTFNKYLKTIIQKPLTVASWKSICKEVSEFERLSKPNNITINTDYLMINKDQENLISSSGKIRKTTEKIVEIKETKDQKTEQEKNIKSSQTTTPVNNNSTNRGRSQEKSSNRYEKLDTKVWTKKIIDSLGISFGKLGRQFKLLGEPKIEVTVLDKRTIVEDRKQINEGTVLSRELHWNYTKGQPLFADVMRKENAISTIWKGIKSYQEEVDEESMTLIDNKLIKQLMCVKKWPPCGCYLGTDAKIIRSKTSCDQPFCTNIETLFSKQNGKAISKVHGLGRFINFRSTMWTSQFKEEDGQYVASEDLKRLIESIDKTMDKLSRHAITKEMTNFNIEGQQYNLARFHYLILKSFLILFPSQGVSILNKYAKGNTSSEELNLPELVKMDNQWKDILKSRNQSRSSSFNSNRSASSYRSQSSISNKSAFTNRQSRGPKESRGKNKHQSKDSNKTTTGTKGVVNMIKTNSREVSWNQEIYSHLQTVQEALSAMERQMSRVIEIGKLRNSRKHGGHLNEIVTAYRETSDVMILDTGASWTIMMEDVANKLWPHKKRVILDNPLEIAMADNTEYDITEAIDINLKFPIFKGINSRWRNTYDTAGWECVDMEEDGYFVIPERAYLVNAEDCDQPMLLGSNISERMGCMIDCKSGRARIDTEKGPRVIQWGRNEHRLLQMPLITEDNIKIDRITGRNIKETHQKNHLMVNGEKVKVRRETLQILEPNKGHANLIKDTSNDKIKELIQAIKKSNKMVHNINNNHIYEDIDAEQDSQVLDWAWNQGGIKGICKLLRSVRQHTNSNKQEDDKKQTKSEQEERFREGQSSSEETTNTDGEYPWCS